jgi:hypothetical protein
MKITTTTSHDISFSVEAFWHEERGMGNHRFGGFVKELPDALRLLELAKATTHEEFKKWVIVGTVESKTLPQ